ncbi:inorganic diphosphatase [bacterium]|nr:inorganic diphosphatase [bacterium]
MDFIAYIEIPANSSIKYELNKKTGKLAVDRFLHTAFTYPFNYGFIENTLAEDGDALDVIILSSRPVQAGVTMKCHPIGLLEMEDEAGIDTKIIAVPTKNIDPEFGEVENIKDVPKATLAKIKHFFENYKALEPEKWVKLKDYKGKAEAIAEIKKSSK